MQALTTEVSRCRPLAFLESCILKGKHYGQLLATCGGYDINDIFSVAFVVTDQENEEKGTRFLSNLEVATKKEEMYTIVWDRQKGLLDAVHTVYPTFTHAY